jgi:hypothetical protein
MSILYAKLKKCTLKHLKMGILVVVLIILVFMDERPIICVTRSTATKQSKMPKGTRTANVRFFCLPTHRVAQKTFPDPLEQPWSLPKDHDFIK